MRLRGILFCNLSPSLKDFFPKYLKQPRLCNTKPQGLAKDEHSTKVYIETRGCQMNYSDTEIVRRLLTDSGFRLVNNIEESNVALFMTCAIREGTEDKIWQRLKAVKKIKKQRNNFRIGILGCMAERLKHKVVEREKLVDIVCGPDAYRSLPSMIALPKECGPAVNTILSLEETYADINPVRINEDSKMAFVSIMRGCDNMCSYCIVPFTRGRERSRPMKSILEEVECLSQQGFKEVNLLGQNVNSYRDTSAKSSTQTHLSAGFGTVYKTKQGGTRFASLLDQVSCINPEMRIRFTSPHPKDFPDEVLDLIQDRKNICRSVHLPAQSGSDNILTAMRRGHTRQSYIELVQKIRQKLPGITFTSDFIAGFCGETEQDHQDTVSLMREIKYTYVYCFPYSMREKTKAYHHLDDSVPRAVKDHRHLELTKTFREEAEKLNAKQVGQTQLVLIEGNSKRSQEDFCGRNDGNTKVIVSKSNIMLAKPGDYVAAKITGGTSQTLKADGLHVTTMTNFLNDTWH